MPTMAAKKRKSRPETHSDEDIVEESAETRGPKDQGVSREETPEETAVVDAEAIRLVHLYYKAVRLRRRRGPQTKSCSEAQKVATARALGTDSDLILSTKLFDKREPKIKILRETIAEVERWWMDSRFTLYYDEPGMRLLKKGHPVLDGETKIISDTVREDGSHEIRYERDREGSARVVREVLDAEEFLRRVQSPFRYFKEEMLKKIADVRQAARDLKAVWPQVVERQRDRLKSAFNEAHYAFDPEQTYDVEITFPTIEVDAELAELDPETYREEVKRREEVALASVARERQRQAETLLLILNNMAKALSERELLDDMYEVTFKRELAGGGVEVCHLVDHKEKITTVAAGEVSKRIKLDAKRRKFNNSTMSRIFAQLQEARQRRDELSIRSPELDAVIASLEKMLERRDVETFAEDIRREDVDRDQVQATAIQIAGQILDMSEMAPRRRVLQGALVAQLRAKIAAEEAE